MNFFPDFVAEEGNNGDKSEGNG